GASAFVRVSHEAGPEPVPGLRIQLSAAASQPLPRQRLHRMSTTHATDLRAANAEPYSRDPHQLQRDGRDDEMEPSAVAKRRAGGVVQCGLDRGSARLHTI